MRLRGDYGVALVEIAEAAQVRLQIGEAAIAVADEVRGACEILGLDPLYVANEGRFVVFVDAKDAERALEVLRAESVSSCAAVIGHVLEKGRSLVTLRSRIGATRVVDMLSGEQLPRIC